MAEYVTVAIDGPASSGKSTVAKQLAQRMNATYVDTGAMYRAITWLVLQKGIDITNMDALENIITDANIQFCWQDGVQHIAVQGRDITTDIREADVTAMVSEVSAVPLVRERLVTLQQAMAKGTSVVMDGRDIGTVVLPNASYKFFLVASPRVRAERRYLENKERGILTESIEELEAAIIRRDTYDSTRTHSPLRKADDAMEIDTSELSIEEVIQTMWDVMHSGE